MSKHYERHAEEVVDAFVGMLDGAGQAAISEDNRNELAMLIEAAISTAVLDQLESTASQISSVADQLRHDAEFYDK